MREFDQAGMHVVIRSFWWFLYRKFKSDTYICIFYSVLSGVCTGLVPFWQGEMTHALESGIDKKVSTKKIMCQEDDLLDRRSFFIVFLCYNTVIK